MKGTSDMMVDNFRDRPGISDLGWLTFEKFPSVRTRPVRNMHGDNEDRLVARPGCIVPLRGQMR